MGTNYYEVRPHEEETELRLHIGKRSFAGKSADGGQKMHFTWAVEPSALEGMTRFADEYGKEFGHKEMHRIITSCEDQDYTFIDREFC